MGIWRLHRGMSRFQGLHSLEAKDLSGKVEAMGPSASLILGVPLYSAIIADENCSIILNPKPLTYTRHTSQMKIVQ